MIRALLVSALSCLVFCAACSTPATQQSSADPASTANPTPKAYDATYETTAAGTTSAMRYICDANGHVRIEVSTPQGKAISLIDYPKKTMWSLVEAQKMAMKLPFNPDAGGPAIRDAQSALEHGANTLGSKVVEGHPCHGWETTIQGTRSESWVGDDINALVLAVTSGPAGETTMRLKSYSAAQPEASLFTVPADYKVMDVPALPVSSGGSSGM